MCAGVILERSPGSTKTFMSFKGKGSRQKKRMLLAYCELLGLFKSKRKHQRWKSSHIPTENCKGIARVCRPAVRKAKSQLKLTLARDVKKLQEKVNQVHQTTSRNKRKIQAHCLTGEVSPKKAEKMEVLNTSFTCLPQHCWTPVLGTPNPGSCKHRPATSKELVCELLEERDPYKS